MSDRAIELATAAADIAATRNISVPEAVSILRQLEGIVEMEDENSALRDEVEGLEEQLREAEEAWRDDCRFMRSRHSWVSGLLHKYDHKYYPAALSEQEEE